ncbi:MAG: prenyltransferase/squalene oxidase repeat-containing protein [Verrucomicrobiota bacterium]|jgi:squalene-hopene/tetraprenyl-beta-curcumene cyclase
MKSQLYSALCLWLSGLAWSAQAAPEPPVIRRPDVSFRNEVRHSIDQGLQWLQSHQNSNGWWSTADHPAVTALALSAFMGEPAGAFQAHPTPAIERGYHFIVDHAKPDGSIYEKGLANYNTAICMMGLIAARNPQYDPLLRKARQWLISQQVDLNQKGKTDSPYGGGVGYGGSGTHSDMNNTFTALEALYYSKYLVRDQPQAGAKDLDWAAAIHFIQSCQNLPAYNKEPWASDDPKDKGGFIYEPGESKAGAVTNAGGRVALRSYGSISYAGMLSYIYADLKPDDPRVVAVYDWLRQNYTVDENPGMGQQGLYYYLLLMTKALAIYGVDQLPVNSGQTLDWRRQVAMKLMNLQKADGSWANENARWWEHDASLVTSYSLISLEILYRGL